MFSYVLFLIVNMCFFVDPKRVKIEIGGRFVDTNITNSKVQEYDEVATYSYWNAETVDLVCHNEQDDGAIYLRYYNATGTPSVRTSYIFKGEEYDNIMFQKTLYTEHNNSMIDCTYVPELGHFEFSYRVIFVQNILKSSGNVKVIINNSQLKSDQNSDTGDVRISRYHYMYFPDEDLKIRCEPLKDGDITPTFFLGPPIDLKPIELLSGYKMEKESEVDVNKLGIKLTEKFTITLATKEAGQMKIKAYILLIKREHPKLRILGLNWEYLVTQYTLTSKDWIIHYRFRAGQVLNITCVASNIEKLWLYESTQEQNHSIVARSVTQIYKMGDAHNNSRIICGEGFHSKQQVVIMLHMDPETRDSQFNNNLINGCVVPLLMLVAMGSLVFAWRYKNSLTKQTDVNQLQEIELPPPVEMANTPMDNGNRSDTSQHEYQYIDVDDTRPSKKREMRPFPEDNDDGDNFEYDYAYAGRSEVVPSSPPRIDSAQNNTTYYWLHQ